MDRYDCPVCKSNRLAWDARSQVFLCLSQTCAASFKPSVRGMKDREVGLLISRGRLAIDPAWFIRVTETEYASVEK